LSFPVAFALKKPKAQTKGKPLLVAFHRKEARETTREAQGEATYKNKNTSLLDSGRRGMDTFKATHLNTDSFNLNDIILLQVALKDKIYIRIRLFKNVQNKGISLYPYDKYNH
jgi:hypothetical protein